MAITAKAWGAKVGIPYLCSYSKASPGPWTNLRRHFPRLS